MYFIISVGILLLSFLIYIHPVSGYKLVARTDKWIVFCFLVLIAAICLQLLEGSGLL